MISRPKAITAAISGLLLATLAAPCAAADRPKVQVRFELAEPHYVKADYPNDADLTALEQLVENHLRATLQGMFRYIEFVDKDAPVVLLVKLDAGKPAEGTLVAPVQLIVTLTGPGLDSEPDPKTWRFREPKDYRLSNTPATAFSQTIGEKFAEHVGIKKDEYVSDHLGFIAIAHEGIHVEGSHSFAIPVKCREFELHPEECEFKIRAKTRSGLKPTKQYGARAAGTIEDAAGVNLPGHFEDCLQAVVKDASEMPATEMNEGVDVLEVFVLRYVRAVSCPEPEAPTEVSFSEGDAG